MLERHQLRGRNQHPHHQHQSEERETCEVRPVPTRGLGPLLGPLRACALARSVPSLPWSLCARPARDPRRYDAVSRLQRRDGPQPPAASTGRSRGRTCVRSRGCAQEPLLTCGGPRRECNCRLHRWEEMRKEGRKREKQTRAYTCDQRKGYSNTAIETKEEYRKYKNL